jgi:hypothetical protein
MKRFKRMSNKFTVDGKFQPKNPKKYKGDYRNIVFRSSWELTVFKYLDTSPSVIQWSSEEFFVPYKHPFTGRFSRYFPDIWLKYKNKEGTITQTVWEIKPKKYTEQPRIPKRKTKNWKYTTQQYIINKAKWESCEEFCKKKGYNFQVITEEHLKHWSTIQPLNT